MVVAVDAARVLADVGVIAEFGATSDGGVSRTSFSAADVAARAWFAERCAEVGLEVETDGAGNIHARLDGPPGPAVWTGSHLDSVPNGGRFDGVLGVLSGLEALRRLKEERVALARPVELVVFADEEGNFHHLFGSHAAVLGYDRTTLEQATGRDGEPLADALSRIGSTIAAAANAVVDAATIYAFVELHIEQGPVLESTGTDIGVVTSIVGLGGAEVRFTGQADHAGTTPMGSRRDALRGAGAFVVDLPEVAASVSGSAVVTCGKIELKPGAGNVVPGDAVLQLDYRDPDAERLEALEQAIIDHAAGCAAAHDVEATFARHSLTAPVTLDPDIIEVIGQAAGESGLSYRRMPSGAGHDSQLIATIAPTGMIFVPSAGGRSHSPAEHTAPEHIAAGVNVLTDVIRTLATR